MRVSTCRSWYCCGRLENEHSMDTVLADAAMGARTTITHTSTAGVTLRWLVHVACNASPVQQKERGRGERRGRERREEKGEGEGRFSPTTEDDDDEHKVVVPAAQQAAEPEGRGDKEEEDEGS